MYEISNMGQVKSWTKKANGGILSLGKSNSGSSLVYLTNSTGRHTLLVCDLVAAAFMPQNGNKNCLVHLNGDKMDNRVCNLSWMRRGSAIKHFVKATGQPMRKFTSQFRLNDADKEEIARIYVNNLLSVDEISESFLITPAEVYKIIRLNDDLRGLSFKPSPENWLPVKGFPHYKVSDKGNVKSFFRNKITGRVLSPKKSRCGYLLVGLYSKKRRQTVPIHRLVASAFLTPDPGKNQVNHIDGNKENNELSNLEWCTPGENQRHAFDNGLKIANKGTDVPSSKLTELEVIEIRSRYAKGGVSQYKLAEKYEVTQSAISDIISRKRWKHI